MKNIFIALFMSCVSILSYGQVKDTTIFISKKEIKIEYSIKLSKSELKKYLDNFRASYISSTNKASVSLKGILSNIPLSQNSCENGSFENNSNDWTGLSLKHSSSPIPIENGLSLNPGILPIPSINNPSSSGNFIDIESPGNDLILTAASPSFNLPKVISGTKSIRLGNNSAGFGAEGIAKRFVVTPQNAEYFFQYAIIMDKSHSYPDGSTNGTEVFFIAEAVDMAGNTIDKIVDIGNPSNPFINAVSSSWGVNGPPNNVFYRNWRCASLDLSSMIGQEVVVMFINSDCSAGAHKGYTYIDAVCETCVNTNEGDININLSPDNCLNFPQTISGTFTLPASGNAINSSINLQIFQNNILVTTLYSPVISGGNYSFTLSPGDFPNQDNGQCYDLVANLTFDIPDMNGNLQTITQTSSAIVNGIQDGETPGINNDVCFCTPTPCCDIEDFDASIQEQNGSFNVTINGGSVPIQEVEISMIDYHVEYSNPDCKPDDMGNFGTLSTLNTTLANLILNASDNNTSSLTWLPGSPGILNGSVNLNIIDPLTLNLDCCDVTFSFCLKVKVKDVNCNVCEKIICYSSDPQTEPEPCDINIKDIGQGKKYCPGDSITLNWSGSTPSGLVNVSLFDNTNNTIYQVLATSIPNTGVFTYTIPAGIPCDPPRTWSLIVEDSESLCMGRSNTFTIECCIQQPDCACGHWLTNYVTVKGYIKQIPKDPKLKINFPADIGKNVDCGSKISLKPSMFYSFTAPNYVCNPENCDVSYKWEIVGPSGVIQAGTGKTFNYSFSNYGTFQVKFTPICGGKACEPCIITVIIDKFIQQDPDPIGIQHDLPSGDVYNPKTGKTWMNKNLGATQVATSSNDPLAYGDLYQWGRLKDGHEKRTSNTTTTLSSSDVPGHGDFIKAPSSSNDWHSPSNNNLWQGVNGVNNPCPIGYRLPTDAELNAERLSWTPNNSAGAFASPLKWTVAGQRINDGSLQFVGNYGFYWTSTPNSTYNIASSTLLFWNNSSQIHQQYSKGTGMSCRCIKN